MYFIYLTTLVILLLILLFLLIEERRLRNNITHGLVKKYWILRERRRFVRFNKELKIRYNLLDSLPNHRYGKTANISRKGLCISTYEKLKEKCILELDIEVPGFPRPLKVIGQVIWIKELHSIDNEGRRMFYAGIKFSKIDSESEARLLVHLNTLVRPENVVD